MTHQSLHEEIMLLHTDLEAVERTEKRTSTQRDVEDEVLWPEMSLDVAASRQVISDWCPEHHCIDAARIALACNKLGTSLH